VQQLRRGDRARARARNARHDHVRVLRRRRRSEDLMDELVRWGWAIVLAFNLLLAWVLWSLRSGFVPRPQFEQLVTRVAVIEQELRHLPTQRDFHQLRDTVSSVKGTADAQSQLLNSMAASVRRIEDYLLKAKA
jgi:hypothetical protein